MTRTHRHTGGRAVIVATLLTLPVIVGVPPLGRGSVTTRHGRGGAGAS